MSVKHGIRKWLWKWGYDICRVTPASHPHARLRQLLAAYQVDTVLDVGANEGQYAASLRNEVGYSGRILSFEPMQAAFEVLKKNAARDPHWQAMHCALGDVDGTSDINVAGNSYSSSLLDMLPAHLQSAPESAYVRKECIEIKRLDSVFDALIDGARNIYLKIDTQGFEGRVLKGGEQSLAGIATVQMEMGLVPLYDGEMPFRELCDFMSARGYEMVALLPGFSDPKTGQLLQVDGIFHRA